MSEFWDQKYSRDDYFYGEQPNTFVTTQACRLTPGARVLVLGDGEGRNGVWLAEQGFDVTGIDASKIGCEKAQSLAKRRGVQLQVICANLLQWSWPENEFDAVVIVYLHFMPEARRQVYPQAVQALKPGGLLLVELFHPGQLGYQSGGPKDERMLVTSQTLADELADMRWLLLTEGYVWLDEGPGHQGQAYVSQAVGQRLPA